MPTSGKLRDGGLNMFRNDINGKQYLPPMSYRQRDDDFFPSWHQPILAPSGCPIIQFSCDTNYHPELASESVGLRTQSYKTVLTFRCHLQVSEPQVINTSVGGSHVPLFRFDNSLEWLTRLRETLTSLWSVYYKGPGGEVYRYVGLERSWNVDLFTNPKVFWTL